jgi:hypothetical protein
MTPGPPRGCASSPPHAARNSATSSPPGKAAASFPATGTWTYPYPTNVAYPAIWNLIAEGEITHAASLVCLLTCLGRGRQAD